ncbi:MAG: hypothetical protein ABSE89_04480 [Sedimentisphaerales bacterium]
MELTWTMRLRIIASLAIGIILLGFLPWNLIKPPAEGVFTILTANIHISDILICAGLAFICGFIASAISSPYGAQTGILAAPAGLVVWGLRSAPLSEIFQRYPSAASRMDVYSKLRLEGFLWLGIVLCGFLAALLADKIFKRETVRFSDEEKPVFQLQAYVRIIIAVIATIFIANFLINILAGDVSYPDSKLARVTAQPANLQIAFAVFITFGACGFLARLFLGSPAFWPAIASAPLIYYSAISYEKKDLITHISSFWPATFFIRPVTAVLPVQMVAFAFLGAIWGYWLAVDFSWWRTHQA